MTTLREAAEMALEALNNLKTREIVETEIAVLRAALASQTVPSDYSDSYQPDAWRTEARNEHGEGVGNERRTLANGNNLCGLLGGDSLHLVGN